MIKWLILFLIYHSSALAGLPPTSTKGPLDTNPVTTFNWIYTGSGVSVSHSGVNATINIPGGSGGVTSVTASAPLASSGGTTPNISLTGTVAAANGGTGLNTSASTGCALVSAGTWSITSLASCFVQLYETVSTTAGDLVYGGAGGTPTRLPIGAAGQVLGVNAGATAPTWISQSSGAPPANWGGISTLTATTTSTSYGVVNGGLSGSITTSGTPQNITCSAASSTIGISCTLPATGNYQVCYTGYMSNGTLGDGVAAELVDGSGTVIVGNQVSYNDYSGSGNNQPFGGCGNYTAASTSKTFQLYGAVLGGGSTGTFAVSSFSVTSLANGGNVSSSSTGTIRIDYLEFSGPTPTTTCTGTCTVNYQSSLTWYTSVTRNTSGQYTIAFAPGEFSSTPFCTASADILNGASSVCSPDLSTASTSSVKIRCSNNNFSSNADAIAGVSCMGPH